jgi:hypothetical protein
MADQLPLPLTRTHPPLRVYADAVGGRRGGARWKVATSLAYVSLGEAERLLGAGWLRRETGPS